jgi:hypothetical protein
MSSDMNARLGELALRMATVFSSPSGGDPDSRITTSDSLLQEDLPMLAQAMLVLSLRMLEPVLSALRHLAQGTPEEAQLASLLGSTDKRFESDQVQIGIAGSRLRVSGCESLPTAFLPWIASNLVGAGALLVPRPFADPESLRQQIGTALVRLDRLTSLQRKTQPSVPGAEAPAMIDTSIATDTARSPARQEDRLIGNEGTPSPETLHTLSEEQASSSPETARGDLRSPKR